MFYIRFPEDNITNQQGYSDFLANWLTPDFDKEFEISSFKKNTTYICNPYQRCAAAITSTITCQLTQNTSLPVLTMNKMCVYCADIWLRPFCPGTLEKRTLLITLI